MSEWVCMDCRYGSFACFDSCPNCGSGNIQLLEHL